MPIFTHVTVGTNDMAKARQFYDAVLAPLGYKRLKDFGDGGSCWGQTTEEFMVLKPADGKAASAANGGTISFVAPSRAAVAAFHKAALDLRGPRMKAPSARAASGRTPMPAIAATSTATSSPPIAASRNSARRAPSDALRAPPPPPCREDQRRFPPPASRGRGYHAQHGGRGHSGRLELRTAPP